MASLPYFWNNLNVIERPRCWSDSWPRDPKQQVDLGPGSTLMGCFLDQQQVQISGQSISRLKSFKSFRFWIVSCLCCSKLKFKEQRIRKSKACQTIGVCVCAQRAVSRVFSNLHESVSCFLASGFLDMNSAGKCAVMFLIPARIDLGSFDDKGNRELAPKSATVKATFKVCFLTLCIR